MQCTEIFYAAQVKGELAVRETSTAARSTALAAAAGNRGVEHDFLQLSTALLSEGGISAATSEGTSATFSSASRADMLAAAFADAVGPAPGLSHSGRGGIGGTQTTATSSSARDTMEAEGAALLELQELMESGEYVGVDGLREEERIRFLRAVASGEVMSGRMATWRPWWLAPLEEHMAITAVQVVEPVAATVPASTGAPPAPAADCEVAETTDAVDSADADAPVPCSRRWGSPRLIPFAFLCKREPPAALPHNLVEILYAYCHVYKLYCGDWEWDAANVAASLLIMSAVLSADARYATLEAACAFSLEVAHTPAIRLTLTGGTTSLGVALAGLHDVTQVLAHRHYVVDALLHLQQALERAGSAVCALAARKVLFYAAFAADESAFPTPLLAGIAQAVQRDHSDRLRSIQPTTGSVRVHETGGPV